MPPYNVFFFGILFFILGVFIWELNWGIVTVLFIVFSGEVFLFFLWFYLRNNLFLVLGGLFLLVLFGFLYGILFSDALAKKSQLYLQRRFVSGILYKDVSSKGKSAFILKTQEVNFLIEFNFFIPLKEGDKVDLNIAESPKVQLSSYWLKEKVVFAIKNPQVLKVEKGENLLSKLIILKQNIIEYFYSILPSKEAALLSGLILGDRKGFSNEFYEAMKKTGTTHIVALSGYNISLLTALSLTLFLYFLPRSLALGLTFLFLISFVVMTGAESSVVRAAIIGILVMVGKELGRFYDVRNVIVLTALLMILFNPYLILMDVGFVLSFLSFIGIVYLKPVLFSTKGKNEDKYTISFMWRNILHETISAQLMVIPILFLVFGSFSPFAFITNLFVLWLVPFIMIIGIAVTLGGWFFKFLGTIGGWILYPFLKTEIFLIEFFSNISWLWSLKVNILFVVSYYILLLLIFVWKKKFGVKLLQ